MEGLERWKGDEVEDDLMTEQGFLPVFSITSLTHRNHNELEPSPQLSYSMTWQARVSVMPPVLDRVPRGACSDWLDELELLQPRCRFP